MIMVIKIAKSVEPSHEELEISSINQVYLEKVLDVVLREGL